VPAPQLSIITPVKNAEKWLMACIESVRSQDYQDWEWIFVDDHSRDNTPEILRKYCAEDARVQYHPNQGEGILPALQMALDLCRGKFVSRMDADDLMPPGRLSKMVELLANSRPQTVVTGLVEYFGDAEISPGYREYQQWLNTNLQSSNPWEQIYRECIIASPNWMMRKQDLMEAGGFDDLGYPEDYDLCFRWYRQAFQLAVIPEVTLHWHEHPERTSRSSPDYQQTAFFKLKLTRFLEIDYQPQRPLCLWGTGTKARLARKVLRQHKLRFINMYLRKTAPRQANWWWYQRTEELTHPQILLAVYPPEPERQKMVNYLHSLGLLPGRHYWFL
jgi:glycosyltransferase involved in cell wall biosynthesis